MAEPPTLGTGNRQPLSVWYTGTETPKALYRDDYGLLVSIANVAPTSQASASQTPAGAPTAASVVLVFDGAAVLDGLRVAYKGSGSVYITLHDAATATSPASSNMLGPGIPISAVDPAQAFLIYEPSKPIRFANGCKICVSSTQDTYTASSDQITVWGQWS